ncbi:YHB1 [[Candida] subhashii]|uniref:nitric oxide dioxygenase n=1 Tax=[Candida] subhashii TaxID=561895 RepID=A0A8J5UU25_9ASCO|nr:YHB1 [[Candida] subhashii]KAG7660364.1 YHB1 [[Candida] subhashii]
MSAPATATPIPTATYESKELTPEQIQIILNTVPILEQAGEVLTQKFYERMIGNYKEVRPFFNEADQKALRQPKILAFALLNYARNIQDLTPLTAFVKQIVVKHIGLQILPEHYPIVGTCLIQTMVELLPAEVATEAFLEAWSTAYGNLAKLLIDLEAEEYKKQPWKWFKDFKITRIVSECSDVKSVYFTPADGSQIGAAKPGQYLCFRWTIPGTEHEVSREYSISEFPKNNEYRISVRHVEGGKVSNFIHTGLKVGDVLKVAPPAGNLIYEESAKDLVYLIGGIGITPVVSMLEKALEDGRNVKLIYCNRSSEHRAFADLLKTQKSKYGDQFKILEIFGKEEPEAAIEDIKFGRITNEDLEFIDKDKHDVYLVGPRPFMRFVRDFMDEKNVPVKFEYFGSSDP